jgi:hypothetical protein
MMDGLTRAQAGRVQAGPSQLSSFCCVRGFFLSAGMHARCGGPWAHGLVWVHGRRRSCAAVSPGDIFLVILLL